MNEEKNIPENEEKLNEQVSEGAENSKAADADDFYEIDNPKREVITSIGDGEMRNEGLVGDGDVPEGSIFSPGTTDEQDTAELRDKD